jgi:hypothetical protein
MGSMTSVSDSENAGYVPAGFTVQHDEIDPSFDPAEQLLPV